MTFNLTSSDTLRLTTYDSQLTTNRELENRKCTMIEIWKRRRLKRQETKLKIEQRKDQFYCLYRWFPVSSFVCDMDLVWTWTNYTCTWQHQSCTESTNQKYATECCGEQNRSLENEYFCYINMKNVMMKWLGNNLNIVFWFWPAVISQSHLSN